jgi:hypothetical protein
VNRRGFLRAVAAAIASVQLPVAAVALAPIVHQGFTFQGPEVRDHGHTVVMTLTFPDGRRIGVCGARCPDEAAYLKQFLLRRATEMLT